MMIPADYTTEEINVKLTMSDIDLIIEALDFTPHNLYAFCNYDKIKEKLKPTK